MAAVKGRKHSVGRPGRTKAIRAWVHPDEVAKADEIATRAGVSLSVYLDLLLKHAQADIDADGYPDWWPEDQRRQELPLTG